MTARVAIMLRDDSARLYSRLINKKYFIEYALQMISQDPKLRSVFFKSEDDIQPYINLENNAQQVASKTIKQAPSTSVQW